jgi:hypothetical protein
MKKVKKQWMIGMIILILFLTGCTRPAPVEPEEPTQEEGSNEATEPVNETTDPEETQEEAEARTVTFGRSEGRVVVNQFLTAINGGNFDIRRILFDRSQYQQQADRINLQLSLYSYQYSPENKSLEIEYRIANPSDLWLYSYRDASMHLSSILETTDGQQAISMDYGYPQTILPPQSYLYFTHTFTEIRNPATIFRIRSIDEEFEIDLSNDAAIAAREFTFPSSRETALSFQEFFTKIKDIENQSWDLIPFTHLTDAKITSINWDDHGGVITLTIIPDAYVPQLALEKEHYRFQVMTDAGEVIPTEIVSVDGQLDEDRYLPREPVTMTLKMNQRILDPCTAIQLHMVYAIPTQESRTIYLEDGTESLRDYDNMDEVSYFSDFISLKSDVSREEIAPVEESFYLEILPLTENRMKSALVEELLPFLETEKFMVSSASQIETFEILEETVHSPIQLEVKIHLSIPSEESSVLEGDFFVLYEYKDSTWTVNQIKFAS